MPFFPLSSRPQTTLALSIQLVMMVWAAPAIASIQRTLPEPPPPNANPQAPNPNIQPSRQVAAIARTQAAVPLTPSSNTDTPTQNHPKPTLMSRQSQSPATHPSFINPNSHSKTDQHLIAFDSNALTTDNTQTNHTAAHVEINNQTTTPSINRQSPLIPDTSIAKTSNNTPIIQNKPHSTLVARSSGDGKPSANDTHHPNNTHAVLAQLENFYQPSVAGQCQGVWQFPKAATTNTNDGSTYAAANHGYYDNNELAELSGNVIIDQNNRQVHANRLQFNPKTGQAYATGNVLFGDNTSPQNQTSSNTLSHDGLMGIANQLNYNTQTGQAYANQIAFASQTLNAHGYAEQLNHPNPNSYQLDNVMFSTCPPTHRVWHLDAKSINLDTQTGRGIAKNATLKIKNFPVFYAPYFNFPIDDRRSSGFLVPHIGIDSNDGLQLSTPYYFNLAPNYDATLTPTVFSNNNPRLAGEFRYLTRFGAGIVDGAYMPNDKRYNNEDRNHLFFDHTWQPLIGTPLTLSAAYRQVSDNNYLSDFDTLGLSNNPLNLPRRLQATYYNDYFDATLRTETYQRLDGTDASGNRILDKDRPYARLPQLAIHYRIPTKTNNWQVGGISNSAYFKQSIKDNSDNEKSGIRLYNQLYATYPWVRSWGYINPKLSLSHLYTSYDEDSLIGQNLSKEEGTDSAFVPSFSVDAGLYFEKQGSPFGLYDARLGGHQLISPRLKYTYSRYQDQSSMPNYETSLASMSYDQLFADSWFLGYDRLSDLHGVSAGINYRYLDNYGNTRLDASIGEQYYIDAMKVGLDNTTPTRSGRSGLAWQASLQPKNNLWLDGSGAFNRDYSPTSLIVAARYQPYANMLFNVGVIERKEDKTIGQLPLSAYTAAAIFPINNRWQLLASTQYDATYSQFMDTLIGIGYEDCCIGVALYGRQYRNDLNPASEDNRAIMAEIRLNGLSGEGRLSRLISERVLGYHSGLWQRYW